MKKILAVDDSSMITFLLKVVLEAKGYAVEHTHDGPGALMLLSNDTYDCLIVDYHLEHTDGLQLVEQVRAIPTYATVPILMITAHNDAEVRQSARIAGVSAWMTKPINPQSLLEIISKVCPLD